MPPSFRQIVGVDFSGAAEAGKNIWIARAVPSRSRLRLVGLNCLEHLSGSAGRERALAHLVSLIQKSDQSVWGIDFPFGLPIELAALGCSWPEQIRFLRGFCGDAKSFGRWCVDQARRIGPKMHIRRSTDRETKTPFDCYHYRIVYQTFHGMRDVLSPLAADRRVAILPFQYDRSHTARAFVVEACPSSTLKRLRLPHQNYKQPAGGPLLRKRVLNRRAILAGLASFLELPDAHRRVVMRNPGGDALDAVVAAVGTWQSFSHANHAAIAEHDRYPLEGHVYA